MTAAMPTLEGMSDVSAIAAVVIAILAAREAARPRWTLDVNRDDWLAYRLTYTGRRTARDIEVLHVGLGVRPDPDDQTDWSRLSPGGTIDIRALPGTRIEVTWWTTSPRWGRLHTWTTTVPEHPAFDGYPLEPLTTADAA